MFALLATIPGEHAVEHTTGIYIGFLLLACLVGILTNRITHLPYTIALTIVGLIIGILRVGPSVQHTGFGKELIFFVMLPPLLFQGALHMDINRLLQNFWPIVSFAVPGVIISTLLIGGIFYWVGGIDSLVVAMLFGAMITPTDPVSVLALFRQANVPEDLRYLVEGESLFNDGTGVVIFTIILGMIIEGTKFHPAGAALQFAKISAGGLVLGGALGTVAFLGLRHIEDHLLENTICLVLAYGAFWLAEVLHVSGVIATVIAGLLIGNYGRRFSMHPKTRDTVETFFASIDFLINSLLFILIGLELQLIEADQIKGEWRPVLAAILGLIVARAAVVYPLYRILNLAGTIRPRRWAHVLFWGGLRGSIPIALLLGLPTENADGQPIALMVQYRPALLVAGFAAVFFSLVVQGLSMKPLLKWLKISETTDAGDADSQGPLSQPARSA